MPKTLEQFEKEVAEKRERLLKDLALAKTLPTNGITVTWTGENGFEKDGNTRKPDAEKTVELTPHIIHSPFRGHEHVAFAVPDSEYAYSPHRKTFATKYLTALLDACEPHIIDTIAVRGHYASLMPANYDYKANRDYSDAVEVARGRYELQASNGRGFSSVELSFYIHTPECGTVEISINLERDFQRYNLLARARTDNLGIALDWSFPSLADVGAVHMFKRANADRNEHGVCTGYTLEWLYDSREKMAAAIGLAA